MAKISITRALAKSKIIRDRISRAGQGTIICVSRGLDNQKLVVGQQMSVADAETRIKANRQKINDLFAFLEDIEAKVTEANATNKVKVCDVEMTVASAIKRKASASLRKGVLDAWRVQYTQASTQVDKLRGEMERSIENALQTVYSNERGRVTDEQAAVISAPKRATMEPGLVDPLNLLTVIEDETAALESFLNEVDFVLSEFNAKTEIELSVEEPA